MPRPDDSELQTLRAEAENQRKTIADLNDQIRSLLQRIEELQRQLQEALEGNSELKAQLTTLQEKLDDLLIQMKRLNDREYGQTSERHNPRQATATDSSDLGDEDPPESSDSAPGIEETDKKPKEKRPRNHKKNINVNAQNLPVQEALHPVKPSQLFCPHCNVETKFVAYTVTHQLERLLQSLVVLEHKEETRSCPGCKQYFVSGEKPCPPIPGALPGPCLLADVVVSKFADALPNYRQESIFEREDAIIPRQTQCDWVISSSLTLEPLHELMKRQLLLSKIIQTDDTGVKIQNRKRKGKMRRGKITAYRGDKLHPYVVFDFSPDETFDCNKKFLAPFEGNVQADAATGFDALFTDGSKTEVGCSAHSRRKYFECRLTYVVICDEILNIYHELYKVERQIRDKDSSTRLSARQDKSKPLIEKLQVKLLELKKGDLNPTNPLMKAVNYIAPSKAWRRRNSA